VVSREFDDLERLVADLEGDQLIDFLVAQNESLVRAEAVRDLTLPTKQACFGQEAKLLGELLKDTAAEVTAAVVTRFLIEYVAARPPTGPRHLTMEPYDVLLACGSEIVNRGFLSDGIQSKLSDSWVPSSASGLAIPILNQNGLSSTRSSIA
jgi:hypothetical protein